MTLRFAVCAALTSGIALASTIGWAAQEAAPAANSAATPSPSPAAAAMSDAEKRHAAACEARAIALLDAAQKGDYDAATADFNPKMRDALPTAKFKDAWESLAQFGKLTARGQSHLATQDGYIAVSIPLVFEKANLFGQVACGSDGRVAGFYVKPIEAAH